MRGEMHLMINTVLHGALDLGGDAMCVTQGDVIGEKEMYIDIMYMPGIAMAQRVEGDAMFGCFSGQRFIQHTSQRRISMIHEPDDALAKQVIS